MSRPVTGIGVGLRHEISAGLAEVGDGIVDFVEVHPENHRDRGGVQAAMLHRATERFAVLTHGLTMGFASPDRVGDEELRALRRFLDEVDAPFHSDHFCFARANGALAHELLPPRFDETTVALAADAVSRMSDALGRQIAIENVSYYVPRSRDPLAEADALAELVSRTGAGLLLDVNNIVVNSHNHGFDPRDYLSRLPLDRVLQIHVAGHLIRPDGLRIDTHGSTSDSQTRELLFEVLRHTGARPVLLERDNEIPSLDGLVEELRELRVIYDEALANPCEAQPFTARPLKTYEPSASEPTSTLELYSEIVRGVLKEAPLELGEGLERERWSLYRSMVRSRLEDLFRIGLPRTRASLGEQAFEAETTRFLATKGPSEPVFWRVVLELGESLRERLEGYELDRLRLDLAVWRVRQAPYPGVDAAIESFDFDRRIVLNPARESFDARFHVDASDEALSRAEGARRIVVVRTSDEAPTILGLNEAAAHFLDYVERERSSAKEAALALVTDRSLAIDSSFLEGLATMLTQWIEVGFVLGVER